MPAWSAYLVGLMNRIMGRTPPESASVSSGQAQVFALRIRGNIHNRDIDGLKDGTTLAARAAARRPCSFLAAFAHVASHAQVGTQLAADGDDNVVRPFRLLV
ncbi:MAG TPA: hypothetical protein VFB34_13855 [Chloroflexota bacterium]|nr:hypothetical protein [Chloroflexota bacterium]